MKIEANYVDIENRRITPVRLEVEAGKIVSLREINTICSSYILPGFIDAHIHVESSMLIPSEFAAVVVTHGTVASVSDPHEIANVLGEAGIDFMLENGAQVPFHFNFGVSSCVPATPFETSGATLDAAAVKKLCDSKKLGHLGEVMAFPSVIAGESEMMAKIAAAKAAGLPIDGHAPGLRGADLQTYIDAGISTDHESSSYDEGLEKLRRGMKILIREGSAARNFEALAPLIEEHYENLMFCSDDRHPNDLVKAHINDLVRRAVAKGYDLFKVLQIACLNPISHYHLDVGSLHVGDSADFIEVKDLENFEVLRTVIKGQVVATCGSSHIAAVEVALLNNFRCSAKKAEDFLFRADCERIEVIEAIDHELLTKAGHYRLPDQEYFESDIANDILKLAVVNRYEEQTVSIGFIKGFGLKEGALASCIAHDSHNIVAVGCDDESLAEAVNLIIASKGGISAVNAQNSKHLSLEIAGIMSQHDGFDVAQQYEDLDRFAKASLSCRLDTPFMTLSFMALLVIPELKLSDKGLFDGRQFHFVPTCEAES